MTEKQTYTCEKCGNKVEVSEAGARPPECCGLVMKPAEPLPVCERAASAEHSRLDDFGEPCDDGRGGCE